MIARRYFTAILLAGFVSTTGVSGGAISSYAHGSDEARPSLEDTSRENVQRVRATGARKAARQINADGYRHKPLQSCTYRGGPKTGTWECR